MLTNLFQCTIFYYFSAMKTCFYLYDSINISFSRVAISFSYVAKSFSRVAKTYIYRIFPVLKTFSLISKNFLSYQELFCHLIFYCLINIVTRSC